MREQDALIFVVWLCVGADGSARRDILKRTTSIQIENNKVLCVRVVVLCAPILWISIGRRRKSAMTFLFLRVCVRRRPDDH
jgi:hypothetical protein